MTDERNGTDRQATGTGRTGDEADASGPDDLLPGVIGGGVTYLPESGRSTQTEGTDAASAEGTVGAVGEMDTTGAPAGGAGGASPVSGGSGGGGVSQGGGPGGGAMSTGGTGPAASTGDEGEQSIGSTIDVLGDREAETATEQ